MGYSRKRLLTHKQIEEATKKAFHPEVSVYSVVAMVVYHSKKSPYHTARGHIGLNPNGTYVNGKLEDGRDKYNDETVVAYELNFGEWLENTVTKLGTSPQFTGHSSNIELEINRLWKGHTYAGGQKPITKTQRKELLKRFHWDINTLGSEEVIKEDKKWRLRGVQHQYPISTREGSVGHKIIETLGEYDDEDLVTKVQLQVHEWARKYKVNTDENADAKEIIKRLVNKYEGVISDIAGKYGDFEEGYEGETVELSLRFDYTKIGDEGIKLYEFSEFVFNEELFPLGEVIPEFDLRSGWETEMVKVLNRHIIRDGYYLDTVVY